MISDLQLHTYVRVGAPSSPVLFGNLSRAPHYDHNSDLVSALLC